MTESYDDYLSEYNAGLSRIRSFLAGTRNRSTLTECERLLTEARNCATAMRGMAEGQGDGMRVRETQLMLERDLAPLAKEVKRALNEMGRQELFYQAPDIEFGGAHPHDAAGTQFSNSDMDALIQSSDDLLRESQSILAETEHIGNTTLLQLGRQREQLENSNRHVEAVRQVAIQAKNILTSMGRRAFKNRLALYAMIAVLGSANIYVLYLIFRKHHHHK